MLPERRVYLPGTEQEWLHAPAPLWHRRLRLKTSRAIYRLWCGACLVVIGAVIGGFL